jgi:MFS family permease
MKRRRGYLESMFQKLRPILNLTVVVASLGYFVDMFDLLLFPVLRQSSLTALGVTGDAQVATGAYLLNMQMAGMLLGGIFWGVLGDKKGRLSTLFGSIALYSIANIANAFVHSVPAYAFWRFAAGLGLAGELGAAVTLVSEVLPRDLRGYGTTIVAAVGIFGVVALFIGITALGIVAYLLQRGIPPLGFYALCGALGLATGYWAVFVTVAAEQFGTNLRATVATTVPNFVRGTVPLITGSFIWLNAHGGNYIRSAWIVCLTGVAVALIALAGLRETHGRDLDFVE